VRHGIVILPQENWPAAARRWRRAEEYGFDHAWTYDHLSWRSLADQPWHATIPTLTAAAMVTDRIGLGLFVASPNYRHPVPFAKELATLDDIAGGRVLVGVGSGGTGFDAYVLALVQCRRFGPASARADQLIAADPLNPNLYSTKAITLASVRRFAEAEQVIQQALALGPDLIWPKAFHAFYLMQMGRLSDARKEFTALGGAGPWVAWAAVAAERSGDRPEADRLIAVMHKSMGDGAHFQYAQVYAQQGRPDEAIAALEAAWDMRDSGLNFLQVDAMMDPLRKDPRFQAIVKRLDFPT